MDPIFTITYLGCLRVSNQNKRNNDMGVGQKQQKNACFAADFQAVSANKKLKDHCRKNNQSATITQFT